MHIISQSGDKGTHQVGGREQNTEPLCMPPLGETILVQYRAPGALLLDCHPAQCIQKRLLCSRRKGGALYTGSDGDQGALGGSLVHWERWGPGCTMWEPCALGAMGTRVH